MAEERSVGELLDELFGFESVAKRQTALEQYDRGELLRKARSRELLGVIEGVEAAERAARESAVRAVDGYVRRVEFDSLARARKQVGVVGPLQMERRYAAFLRMEDKAELLARLEQTLAFIEVKLRANTADRVRAAYDAAGALVLQGAARLSDVRVVDAAPLDADLLCTQLEQLRCAADTTDLAGMITATFESELSATGPRDAGGFAGGVAGDVAGDVALERELTNVRGAAQRARLAAQAYRAERAARVAGSAVEPVSLPQSACVVCETACDAGELSELLAQVKKSFETYRRVVADGGLFCAFGAGSPHGICRGSSYFDYDARFDEDVLVGEYDGATRHNVRREVAIPELVDEASADGGDSLAAAVARMREFNARRYDGVLDEDPACHVNAFWYGLKKLNQYCEAAVRVDERAWDCFIDKVQFAYDEPAGRLAMQMDDKQVAAFVAAVDALGAAE
ncbi:hypothetical protein [Collinsella sp. AM34-10]|uniref:hypothetical protein n=1 Tax=Collinsella sp. AM34-10 TaxID=2292316 RepID=UPI000E4C2384|nr:hypothetical protein [Collinsella sp. AM34-10]RHC93004.1 hypothetical protein DW823_01220 [Collinsella sp. AM34-10]